MRLLPLALLMPLAACSGGAEPAPQATDGAETIECAIGPGGQFGPDCMVEQKVEDGRNILIVRHPDGSFRRFIQLTDGHGLEVADGADKAVLSYDKGVLEVGVGGDRYRFPATARGTAEKGDDAGHDAGQ